MYSSSSVVMYMLYDSYNICIYTIVVVVVVS